MIVFGVELKASDANVVVVEKDSEGKYLGKEYKKIPLVSIKQEDVKSFRDLFTALIDQYSPSKLVINTRNQKGEYAAGAVTFVMEGVLLTLDQVSVISIAGATVRAKLNSGVIQTNFDNYPKYTKKAFQLACIGCL